MESEALMTKYQPSTRGQFVAAVVPVLWIAISYVDPGKWAASVEGGARIGLDLSLLVLIINCAAILCQYLSARVSVATGKNLAKICSEEYGDLTCVLLGIQAEISMVVLDLAMVLGTAYGLNSVFGIDLFNCVFLTGFDVVLFPFVASLLETPRAKISTIFLACLILASCGSGVLISQSESSISIGGILNRVTGENTYALMGVLGANIMPHNFYLHSAIVQGDQGQTNISKESMCFYHFFAISVIFSGIFVVNSMLVNLAASVFYSSGISSLTSQDALSLLDQGFRSSIFSVALVFVMFVSNQLVAVSWSLGRQVTIHDFFGLEIPSWLHRATIRIFAIIPALFCVWSSGAEGIFQLLIFTQVLVALLLPSAVIPLFRVASSRSIMGSYKVSRLVEFFSTISFVGMLGLKIVFVIELVFGTSDWVITLKWNTWSSVPISYLILLIAAFASMCLMLWLAIIPLRSTRCVDVQALCWDKKVTLSSTERGPTEISEQQPGKSTEKQEPVSLSDYSYANHQSSSTPSSGVNFPDTLADSETNRVLTTIEENISDITFPMPSIGHNPEAVAIISESGMSDKSEWLEDITMSNEMKDSVEEKTLRIERDVQNDKDDEGESWKPEESIKDVSESNPSFSSDGPGSFRCLSGKNNVGSGAGSLSRLAGLGRAARRQLTTILDEFWGQLFDLHGLATNEAKSGKLDVVLGIESKIDAKSSFSPVKLQSVGKDSSGKIGPDLLRAPSFYPSSMGQSNLGSPLGIQQGSAVWANRMQLLDAYVRKSSQNTFDADERRYRSMHVPSSSDGHDQQPATIHGYDLASYLGRMTKEKGPDYQKSHRESVPQASTPSAKPNSVDSYGRPLGPKPQNGLLRPPGFHNVPVSRNNSLKYERPVLDISSSEVVDYGSSSPNVKKFHSLPDISGLYIPHRDSLSDKSSHWDSSMGYGQSINRPVREQMRTGGSARVGTALGGFNELSPPKVYRDVYPSQFGYRASGDSLWTRQPYEQFGVANKPAAKIVESAASSVDVEAKLLQSLRGCINRLVKLEGSEWLFRQNDGADEDLIDRVGARERFIYEVEMKMEEAEHSKLMSVPNCGDGCVWHVDVIVSFGVWCIHRILELSLMESRPELWGKYTYVLNRLQGIIDVAFWKPRSPMVPCFCLELPAGYEQEQKSPITNGSLPPPSKLGRGKFTTAAMLLEMVKDVEIAISCRKGRTGTAAGDVAFPKGKENLASVLKRYKRRLSNKAVKGN